MMMTPLTATAPVQQQSSSVHQLLITADETVPWYAVRLFHRNLLQVMTMLDREHMTYFVPMHYREYLGSDGKLHRRLVPVINNLLFLKKTATQKEIVQLFDANNMQAHILPKERNCVEGYEIPTREMRELIYICDPDKVLYEIITADEAAMKPGAHVMVTHGPMKGYHGRLVRKHHNYFLLRPYTGFAVMVKVTKWCCKPVHESES